MPGRSIRLSGILLVSTMWIKTNKHVSPKEQAHDTGIMCKKGRTLSSRGFRALRKLTNAHTFNCLDVGSPKEQVHRLEKARCRVQQQIYTWGSLGETHHWKPGCWMPRASSKLRSWRMARGPFGGCSPRPGRSGHWSGSCPAHGQRVDSSQQVFGYILGVLSGLSLPL